jgi:type I restriction enzyme S subunit
MRSNYKRLGDYIQEINVRNTELTVNNLLGINIDKFFMPSVANIVGTDMTKYKIVKNGQFACNRMHVGRDKRLPVAYLKHPEDIIVSPAYNVFEIIDKEVLNPEYLMMWFLRKEFDRNAWFYTDADVRGGLNWKDFCNMQFPIHSITKQKEIVREYNVLVDRISLNNRLIRKLEETAKAIYKQWFVDFEFPDENGQPYKSNGGEMEFNNELDKEIPKGWRVGILSDVVNIIMGQSPDGETYNTEGNGTPLVNGPVEFGEYFTKKTKWTTQPTKLSAPNDLIICVRGSTVGRFVKSDDIYCLGRGVCSFRAKISQQFVDLLYKHNFNQLISLTTGSTFPNWDGQTLSFFPIIIPKTDILEIFEMKAAKICQNKTFYSKENILLEKCMDILLSKLARMEG